ncbi:MAG: cephalosporin hydroxylase family protein [Candidatus Helarchaeota archaeon]
MNWPTLEDIAEIKKYVKTKKNKDIAALKRTSKDWIRTGWENNISYEITWFGIPVIQLPNDLILMQELIFLIKPKIIIESGIAHGGSLIFYSSMLELLGQGKIIGVDIEIRSHNRKAIEAHPLSKKIKLIERSSTDLKTIEEIKNEIGSDSPVLVCLDSNHTKDHVLKELNLYSKFVTKGSYIVVFDTIMPELVGLLGANDNWNKNNPAEAIKEFLKKNKDFEIDTSFNKLYVSYCPNGFLRKK